MFGDFGLLQHQDLSKHPVGLLSVLSMETLLSVLSMETPRILHGCTKKQIYDCLHTVVN